MFRRPFNIIESEFVTVEKKVKRTWGERLFSWPWNPWQSTKIINVPDEDGYLWAEYGVICHPIAARKLREQLAREEGMN